MKQISLDHRNHHNHIHNHHRGPLTDNMASEEICPVCKSSRYLNASLRFLVNPACYHKMCESCVDRLFSHGPQPCPIPGCRETLRKNRFRKQTFEDIQVEREVDIRRKVASVFNRREDEFETIRDYNDYLNDVEDITFNLINKIDLEETERRFEQYEKAHQAEIAENASLAQQESINLVIKGLKAKVKAEPEAPIDPFGGLSFEGMKYYNVQDRYVWDILESAERDSKVTSGGYEVASFTQRALCEAFSGLGCFVADAATEKEKSVQDDQTMVTRSAEAMGAQDVKMEDPFD
ncbi:uncharacterized protein MYCFIDRAFT_127703 [Pseudocercospora fijiensis CIRAD86]|uniref:RNA polymerase II transcription factor B subunit 3 n=1 Tax=Pseudocercospora fijiensis (strain CIRAD86) TaxID=383855 RepID=N1Q6M5_PSEFD|nr:uncharacterized protein MYCFIDRAFT_127703 [Pseudocercospora fijiensis CIRAD86]EME88099.1 hypothetical protein MYCFIDRAFT_127703 [Pseudocercospora fijiensis CIRAD86]